MNKKFYQLNNLQWLKAQIKAGRTIADIAKEVGCFNASVRYVIDQKFTAEEKAMVKPSRALRGKKI